MDNKDDDFLELLDRFSFVSTVNVATYMELILGPDKYEFSLAELRTDIPIVSNCGNFTYCGNSIAFFLHMILFYPAWITMSIVKKRPELLNMDILGYGPPLRIAISSKKEDLVAGLIELRPEIHHEVYALLEEVPEKKPFLDLPSG